MKKIFLLGWKDLTLAFRDKAALLLMLLAPFALTLGMGLVTGSFSGGSSNSGISAIPIVLVNEDDGALGKEMVQFFTSAEMSEIMLPTEESSLAQAKAQVDEDQIAAVIHIPAGFTASIIPQSISVQPSQDVKIDLYLNSNRPTSSGIIQSIVEQFVYQAQAGSAGVEVMVTRLVQSGLLAPQQIAETAEKLGEMQAQAIHGTPLIALNNLEQGSAPTEFNLLAYMAPGMALMFLMFTVSYAGRTLLVEKTQGTLPRLLVTPIGRGQVLLGKMLGVFFTGLAQMLILVLASTLLFQLRWGDPLAVLLLVVAAVMGAVGWGMLLTSIVKTPGQAATYGSALMLIFGILGGSFFDVSQLPGWFRSISQITPNAWGIDGFQVLALGGKAADILPNIGALLVMAVALFGIALFLFNRRGVIQG